MSTSLELTPSAIRLCRESRGKLVSVESFPIPPDVDPLVALANAPLPRPLGRVNLVLHHDDILLRTMLQPPCPPDRLNRIVRFELQGMSRDETEPVALCWHVVKGLGAAGDMRILAQLTKRRLLDTITKSIEGHGGKLDAVIHPAVALFHSYQRQAPADREDGLIVDVGAKHLHLALVSDGELLFLRTVTPGLEELAVQIAEARSLSKPDAEQLLAKLGKGCPGDLLEAIRRQAQVMAGTLANNLRFAKAQLHLEKFEPKTVWLSGAPAQVYGFAEALRERMQCRVRMLNPFAGILAAMSSDQLDQHAALPSPWTSCIGASFAERLELDALSEDRELRKRFWRTDGALRAAAAGALALAVLAWLMQMMALSSARAGRDDLEGPDGKSGLVPAARTRMTAIDAHRDELATIAAKAQFLDGERRPGRITSEMLAAIADQQDPATCPVVISVLDVTRHSGFTKVEIEGIAETAPNRSTSDVLRSFLSRLAQRYEPITGIEELTKAQASGRQEFKYALYIADHPPAVMSKAASGRTLTIKVAADERVDAKFVALAMVARLRGDEDEVTVTVVAAARPAEELGTFKWSVTKPLERMR